MEFAIYVLSTIAPSGQHMGVGGHADSSKTGQTGGGITIGRGLGEGAVGVKTRTGLLGTCLGTKRGLAGRVVGTVGIGVVGLGLGVVGLGLGVVGLVGLGVGLVGALVGLLGVGSVGAPVVVVVGALVAGLVGALVGALVGGLGGTMILSPSSSTGDGIEQSSLNRAQSTKEKDQMPVVHVAVRENMLQHS